MWRNVLALKLLKLLELLELLELLFISHRSRDHRHSFNYLKE
jgi:hypothetical protein